ncbi:MAG TPA: hypothetical protein PKO45_14660 [Rubrivivax sp.]|nr:hypothetical protein [Rubrivivax sp.]
MTPHPTAATPAAAAAAPQGARAAYLAVLAWSFAFFSSVRMLAYLPTIAAIHVSGDSGQHSLLTWLTWLGANATMAAWLYENNGQRLNRAALVCAGNAAMCLATTVVIVWHRL